MSHRVAEARAIILTLRHRPNQKQEEIHGAAMNVMRELGDWKPLDAGNLHEFRLKVKQLRYTLQLDAHADPGWWRRWAMCSAASATGTTGTNWTRSRARFSFSKKTRRCSTASAKPPSADSIARLRPPMRCAENT